MTQVDVVASRAPSVRWRDGELALTREQRAHVDGIWAEQSRARPHLTDGALLSCIEVAGDALVGIFVPYRVYLAQKVRPEVDLGVRPIATSGVVVCGDAVLVGRRAEWVSAFPGAWELLPAGGLDRAAALASGEVDIVGKLLEELEEEVGIARSRVVRVRPFGAVYDRAERVYDCCSEVMVEDVGVDLARTKEYSEARWVPRAELDAFLRERSASAVAASVVSAQLWLQGAAQAAEVNRAV